MNAKNGSDGSGANGGNGGNGHTKVDGVTQPDPVRLPGMVSEEIQTSEMVINTGQIQRTAPRVANEEGKSSETFLNTTSLKKDAPTPDYMESQTAEALTTAARIKSNVAEALRSSAERFRSSLGSDHRKSCSKHSTDHCPVFDVRLEATSDELKKQVEALMPKAVPYIVIGWFRKCASDPKERILEFENEEDLFKVMRRGEKNVRGYREYFSLKSLKGFGLYKVCPSH